MADNAESIKMALIDRLRHVKPARVAFVGVGNRLRGDDAIGPALIDLLKGRVPNAIDADNAPENVTSAIRRLEPQAIIFIDAAGLGDAPPGHARIVEAKDVEKIGATAHNISLEAVMEYLKETTGADVFMLGVQPERIGEGEGISPGLRRPLEELARAIVRALKG